MKVSFEVKAYLSSSRPFVRLQMLCKSVLKWVGEESLDDKLTCEFFSRGKTKSNCQTYSRTLSESKRGSVIDLARISMHSSFNPHLTSLYTSGSVEFRENQVIVITHKLYLPQGFKLTMFSCSCAKSLYFLYTKRGK